MDRTKLCEGPGTVSVLGEGDTFDVGSLGSGVEMSYTPEFLHINPQQAMGDIKSYKTREGVEIGFTIWEPTLKNLDLFMFGGDGTYAGGALNEIGGVDVVEELEPVVIYGTAPGGFQRTIFIDRAVAVEPGGYVIDRTASHGFDAKLKALIDPNDGTICYIEDAVA
jgi:hypothetical protein